ncbi:HAD family acid phosphatase [Mesorhizobium sp. LjRoot246]|uniref:HAD family acid phosphatase n=1 Tax=Mesorhizobium sp. LjRoot246 TaxID=3342294 RepID=UPI003ECF62D3
MGRIDIPSKAIGAAMLVFSVAAIVGFARSETAFVASASQPINVGDAIAAAAAYHESGTYQRDLASVAQQATAWILEGAESAEKPAVVFDIDETALANWDVIKRDNFGRPIAGPCDLALDGPCGWAAWDQLALDPAIAPTLEIFQQAKASKVAVFFITGRPEDQRQATERNLRESGYDGFEKVYMVPVGAKYGSAADFKTPVRAEIEAAGYTIIANIGDQPSDLFGGHAQRLFLLPNPFYRVP